jgi:hypothetical protein
VPYAYYHRLNAGRQRIYRRSDAIDSVDLSALDELQPLTSDLAEALQSERRKAVSTAVQALADALTNSLQVEPVEVVVELARPRGSRSELHGLYEPGTPGQRARISVWMRTAQRRQIVAFRTFLRTFVHEVCHHLDYELYGLSESFHTQGFFQRESSLYRQLMDT